MLSEDVVNGRVAAVPSYDVDLDPAVRDVTTTRLFTSKQWGGNTQSTFPNIRPEMLARHGLDDFMYLNLFLNPHAPQWPGAPGLFFTSSVNPTAHEWPKIERVLVRLKSNCWLYVGQYQCTPAPSLTTDEWKSQAPKVNTLVSMSWSPWTSFSTSFRRSSRPGPPRSRRKVGEQTYAPKSSFERGSAEIPPSKSSKTRSVHTRNSTRHQRRFSTHSTRAMLFVSSFPSCDVD